MSLMRAAGGIKKLPHLGCSKFKPDPLDWAGTEDRWIGARAIGDLLLGLSDVCRRWQNKAIPRRATLSSHRSQQPQPAAHRNR